MSEETEATPELSQDAKDFIAACQALAEKLQDVGNSTISVDTKVEDATSFVQKAGSVLSWCSWIPVVGSTLADVGKVLTSASVATDDVADKVMDIANTSLDMSSQLDQVVAEVEASGTVTAAAESILQQASEQTLTPFATALKNLFSSLF